MQPKGEPSTTLLSCILDYLEQLIFQGLAHECFNVESKCRHASSNLCRSTLVGCTHESTWFRQYAGYQALRAKLSWTWAKPFYLPHGNQPSLKTDTPLSHKAPNLNLRRSQQAFFSFKFVLKYSTTTHDQDEKTMNRGSRCNAHK